MPQRGTSGGALVSYKPAITRCLAEVCPTGAARPPWLRDAADDVRTAMRHGRHLEHLGSLFMRDHISMLHRAPQGRGVSAGMGDRRVGGKFGEKGGAAFLPRYHIRPQEDARFCDTIVPVPGAPSRARAPQEGPKPWESCMKRMNPALGRNSRTGAFILEFPGRELPARAGADAHRCGEIWKDGYARYRSCLK